LTFVFGVTTADPLTDLIAALAFSRGICGGHHSRASRVAG